MGTPILRGAKKQVSTLFRMEAARPPLQVRVPNGPYVRVLIDPRSSMDDAKLAVATAVFMPVGSFGLQNDTGVTVIYPELTGDWTAVALRGWFLCEGGWAPNDLLARSLACRSLQADMGRYVSTEINVPVLSVQVAMWLRNNPLAHFLFSFGWSTALLGLSNCPRLWVPALLCSGNELDCVGLSARPSPHSLVPPLQ